jgi:hypothetical protein
VTEATGVVEQAREINERLERLQRTVAQPRVYRFALRAAQPRS